MRLQHVMHPSILECTFFFYPPQPSTSVKPTSGAAQRRNAGVDQAAAARFDMDISDMRSVRQASASLQNDVNNLKRRIDTSAFPDAELDGKVWSFQGSSGRHVLVDRRNPEKFDTSNARYTASSWKVGFRSTEINPLTGTHSYDTGNLYRTVHWRDVGNGFGLNGHFTNDLARAGMWKNEGLNNTLTKSKTLENPNQWGTPKIQPTFM
eukprot:scaffold86287_cov63-Phaeocystis_antarctica.AAC.4